MAIAVLALFAASCTENGARTPDPLTPPDSGRVTVVDEGKQFEPAMLGLMPGATTAEVRFNWYAGEGVNNAWVRLFRDGGLVSVTKGASGGGEVSWHKAAVSGLTPGTAYEYSVSNDSVNWSHRYAFRVPGSGAFAFAAIADAQLSHLGQDPGSEYFSDPPTVAGGWLETMGKIGGRNVGLVVSAGDQVNREDCPDGAEEFEYKLLFAPPEMRSIPFAPVMGNHDRHDLYAFHYNPPNAFNPSDGFSEAPGAHSYFYLYNNVLFVAANTSCHPTSAEDAAPHVEAISELLARAKSAHRGKYDWLVVVHHKSTHSQAAHAADHNIGYWVRAGFNRLMEEHGVDIVISGHDHSYSRSHVVTTADADSMGEIRKDATSADNRTISLEAKNGGTVFFGLTTASGLKYYNLYAPSEHNKEYPYLLDGAKGSAGFREGNPSWAANVIAQNHTPEYTIFEVNGKTIRSRTYRVNDDVNPVDDVTIIKAGPASVVKIPMWAPLKTTAPAPPNGCTTAVRPLDGTSTVVFRGALNSSTQAPHGNHPDTAPLFRDSHL